jgi:hypothetical protein
LIVILAATEKRAAAADSWLCNHQQGETLGIELLPYIHLH